MDFDLMLVSVLPHKYFIKFLQEEKQSHLPYLQIIHICTIYLDESQSLTQIEHEIAALERATDNSMASNNRIGKRPEDKEKIRLEMHQSELMKKIA